MRNLGVIGGLLMMLILGSCLKDDQYASFHYESRGIDSVVMPDTASLHQRVPIKTFTQMLGGCENFQTHGYDRVGNERTVTAWFVRYDEVECSNASTVAPLFYFVPERSGTYHFRFWAGVDEETQEDVFLTKDIYIR